MLGCLSCRLGTTRYPCWVLQREVLSCLRITATACGTIRKIAMNKKNIITIDGPAASGKSSIAQALAQKLGYYYLYTGLLYRAVAYIVTHIQKSATLPEDLTFIGDISYEYHDGKPHVFYKGQDITSFLQDGTLDQQASIVSANMQVRQALLQVQRAVANNYDIIADGRDCGSVVFPDADVKFFLTADVTTRATRLFNDPKRKNTTMTFEQIRDGLVERDDRDQSRAVAPLTIPDGAVVIDNSKMDLQQTIDEFLDVIAQKLQ
jgi:cytidylate kinase